jgi:hypothetical protein
MAKYIENQGANVSKCNNDGRWSVYCFMIQVCQIQVLHSYKNCNDNYKFEKKVKNLHEDKRIYVNWKKKSEAKLAQCLQQTTYIFISK